MTVKLHVNVDHVATLRQARGSRYPDPVHAAVLAERAGADGITVHLREDRRHIQDRDVRVLRDVVTTTLNLEMAATAEMRDIARATRPDLVTLVPERRAERTTEGGLDVVGQRATLRALIASLRDAGIGVSLFIAPDEAQVRASAEVAASMIELHTGEYAHAHAEADVRRELDRLALAATTAEALGLRVAAGHGLTLANVGALVARIPELEELNIGHAIVSDAVFEGFVAAVERMRAAIADGDARR